MAIPLRLLLIEDSEDDALLIARELKRAGYTPSVERVDTAAGLTAALDRERWDMVVSDFNMPTFNGLAALRVLRARDPETPFIFVSGTIGEDVAVDAMRAGAQDYVIKGNLKRLAPAIERELREVEGRRQRRRAEQALHASERRMAAILNAALDAVITMDEDGAITGWNPRAEALFGWPAAEAAGRRLTDTIIPPQHRAAHVAGLKRFLETGEGPVLNRRIEITALHRDGREFPVELAISPLRQGDRWMFSAFVRDLTDHKSLQAQLIQAQKMEAVGQLAGGIAHDFNNLLGAITVFGELAAGDLPEGDPRREDLGNIQDAVVRATTLTRQLLTFSRHQVPKPVVLDPNAVIENLLKILHRLIGEDVELVTELAHDVGAVRADAGQLEQVLLNLAVNARDAMPAGGKLVIATSRTELDVHAARQRGLAHAGDYVVIAVSDTGSGMSPEVRARVFEPFFSTKGAKGTGLGLATAHVIIRQSDGHIGVASEPGAGTTFTIHLPLASGMTGEHPVAKIAETPTRGTETILLAEDDPAVRLAASTVLKRLGYTVLVARTAEEALAKAEAHGGKIHLVVSDVVMPGMDGGELIQRLRLARPGIKAVLTSGYAGDPITSRGVLESDIPFLEKPFTSSGLANKVREVLDAPASRPAS